ncbi:hypothetical protein V1477_021177 [Vespula maculifrons]
MDLPYMNKLNKSLATTPTDEILPQTATPYDRANYGGGSRWDESVHSTQFIDSDVMLAVTGLILKNEIKGVPYTSGMESTYRFTLLLGNTINRRVGINSKAIPFERSSCLKLTVIDNNKKEKKEGNIFNGHEDEPSRVPCILAYKTTFERWYDAREYILSKDPMVSSFIRVYNRLRSERVVRRWTWLVDQSAIFALMRDYPFVVNNISLRYPFEFRLFHPRRDSPQSRREYEDQ